MFNSFIVCSLWPDNSNNNIVNLYDSSFSERRVAGATYFKYFNTTFTSHIDEYLGRAGRIWQTPLRNLVIKGWFPMERSPGNDIKAESALLAEFSAPYPQLLS